MKKALSVLSALLSAALMQAGCASSGDAIRDTAFARADFRVRDPFVLAEDGIYYLYESKPWDGGRGVFVRISSDLEHWTDKQQVMRVADDLPVRKVWAPEVHKYKGAYYLFVTLTMEQGAYAIAPLVPGREDMVSPRGTWVYKADSPMGPFVPVKNGPVPPQDWMTLDGTLYVEDGQPYMVFCHEWCQMKDGRMCYAPLAPDFGSFTAAPTTMFKASDAMAGAGFITDGPFLYLSPKSGALYMIWSNTIKRDGKEGPDYCVFVRKSSGGRLAGPWSKDDLLFSKNGGHGMIFKTFDGRLMLTLHQPNVTPDERMALFEIEDTGETLRIRR
ncbi:MAG: family 43 glycosylhydrolase [Kiritimatiellae bacterium]|nr:family 43 glycosylhydrolase [Kiritimatiellia bacterium]